MGPPSDPCGTGKLQIIVLAQVEFADQSQVHWPSGNELLEPKCQTLEQSPQTPKTKTTEGHRRLKIRKENYQWRFKERKERKERKSGGGGGGR